MWLLKVTCFVTLLLLLINCISANVYDYDDDVSLDFIWIAATGTVNHYNVYASIDGNDYILVGTTTITSYTLIGEDHHKYRMKVQAVDVFGNLGPMSEESDPVICRLTPWDTNNDGKVDTFDLTFVAQHFGETISEPLEINPDVNGDGIVNILDLVIIVRYLGNASTNLLYNNTTP